MYCHKISAAWVQALLSRKNGDLYGATITYRREVGGQTISADRHLNQLYLFSGESWTSGTDPRPCHGGSSRTFSSRQRNPTQSCPGQVHQLELRRVPANISQNMLYLFFILSFNFIFFSFFLQFKLNSHHILKSKFYFFNISWFLNLLMSFLRQPE